MSVGVGSIFESACLFGCLFVCQEHNSKRNIPKVFKLGVGNDLWSLDILQLSDMVLG